MLDAIEYNSYPTNFINFLNYDVSSGQFIDTAKLIYARDLETLRRNKLNFDPLDPGVHDLISSLDIFSNIRARNFMEDDDAESLKPLVSNISNDMDNSIINSLNLYLQKFSQKCSGGSKPFFKRLYWVLNLINLLRLQYKPMIEKSQKKFLLAPV